jgi:hypothetical protein
LVSAVQATSEGPRGLGNHGGLPLHMGYIFTPSAPFERAYVGVTPRGRPPLLPLTGPLITRWRCVQNEALRVFPVKFPLLGVIKDILLYLHQFIDIADNPFVIIPLP